MGTRTRRRSDGGFTLVEIMIVVGIIGILIAIAIPGFRKARIESRISLFMNNLRLASDAFEMYAMENGTYPPDANRSVVPIGMEAYLPKMKWTELTPIGGKWDWERNVFGVRAAISVVEPAFLPDEMTKVDERVDDGDIHGGRFRFVNGDRYIYVMLN